MNAESLPTPSPAVARRGLRIVRSAPEQLPLDLRWEVSPGVPAQPAVPALLHVVGDPDDPTDASLPDPRRWTAQLAQAVSEVLAGSRPAAQLTRWLARDQLARISARAAARALHPSARAQRGVPRPRTVRAVRVCPVAPGIVEASAVLVGGERAQAIAVRLEATAGRWVATVVDVR
ncbi:MAG: Rv3235 family protein [Candidatus Nanopelagicales bacterium]